MMDDFELLWGKDAKRPTPEDNARFNASWDKLFIAMDKLIETVRENEEFDKNQQRKV